VTGSEDMIAVVDIRKGLQRDLKLGRVGIMRRRSGVVDNEDTGRISAVGSTCCF
jgi:hypothetical protein